jgi:hypothetical protein
MASIYEKPPHYLQVKTWDEKTPLPETYKLQSNDSPNKVRAAVHQDSGKLGVEVTGNKTIPEFNKKIHLDWTHSFLEFENMLQGQYKTAWKQIVHKFYSEPVDAAIVPAEQDCLLDGNFCHAIKLSLTKALHKEKPRDRQYIYLAPGGDYNIEKVLVTGPSNHPGAISSRPAQNFKWNGPICHSTSPAVSNTSALAGNSTKRPFRLLPSTSSLSRILE